jgi:hypothetical protein
MPPTPRSVARYSKRLPSQRAQDHPTAERQPPVGTYESPKACSLPSPAATDTMPLDTAGDESTALPVGAVHNGAHVLGVPDQPVFPVASKA